MSPRAKLSAALELGTRVRKRRKELELSQEKLAERADLHWTYISSVERGERNVTLSTLTRLANALSVDPADLVRGLKP
jgi:transcriptional regulator with XRE-family HTH domain